MRIRTGGGAFAACLALLLACHEVPLTTAAEPATAVRRRALLIGIDEYSAARAFRSPAPTGRSFPTLHGTVRDVELLRTMLIERYGFEPASIITLKNREATREAILGAIERHLIAPAAKDDVVFFYYAGHGSQAPNSLSPELDKLDETIVPADAAAGAKDIRDKDLRVLFNKVLDREARLTVVFDSCHSGSISRGLSAEAAVRAVAPSTEDVRDAATSSPPEARGALVLSATKDYARAFEKPDEEGNYHGVFSWAWLRAMRDATPGEPAADTFLRAQALMRAESPYQDPVMSGDETAKLTPLFSSGAVAAAAPTVAVEQIQADRSVVLQGGWAHGLTIGTELKLRNGDGSVRLRIIQILGPARSRASIVSARRGGPLPLLASGALLEIAAWAAPEGQPMRVWIPVADDVEPLHAFAEELKKEASRGALRWIDDPVQNTPSHVLRWRDGAWDLMHAGALRERLAAGISARQVAARLNTGALYVQLPVSSALVRELRIGARTEYDSVQEAKRPGEADYVLAGRLSATGVEYAWVRPEVEATDRSRTPLPPRSEWQSAEKLRDAAIVLRHAIVRLHKILAWHVLPSPPESRSPYRLVLVRSDGSAVDDGIVRGGQQYALLLRTVVDPLPVRLPPRYYYVFGIDSFGRSVLLFPLFGSVENRFPIDPQGRNPLVEVPVGSVNAKAPYGLDTYFLISTEESIPNPSILQWAGVRTRGPKGSTPLEELLSRTGGASRSMEPVLTSPAWSIDHVVIESMPPVEESHP